MVGGIYTQKMKRKSIFQPMTIQEDVIHSNQLKIYPKIESKMRKTSGRVGGYRYNAGDNGYSIFQILRVLTRFEDILAKKTLF